MTPDPTTTVRSVDPRPFTSRFESIAWWCSWVVIVLLVGTVAAVGFLLSFETVSVTVEPMLGRRAWLVPLVVDAVILLFSFVDLMFIWGRVRARRTNPDARQIRPRWVPFVPRFFIGVTLALNVAGDAGDPIGWLAHGVGPIVYVVSVELLAVTVRNMASGGIPDKEDLDRIRLGRWLRDPLGTNRLRRDMVLNERTSLEEALAIDLLFKIRKRLHHASYGRWWNVRYWRLTRPERVDAAVEWELLKARKFTPEERARFLAGPVGAVRSAVPAPAGIGLTAGTPERRRRATRPESRPSEQPVRPAPSDGGAPERAARPAPADTAADRPKPGVVPDEVLRREFVQIAAELVRSGRKLDLVGYRTFRRVFLEREQKRAERAGEEACGCASTRAETVTAWLKSEAHHVVRALADGDDRPFRELFGVAPAEGSGDREPAMST